MIFVAVAMFLLKYEVTPVKGNPDVSRIGGAYVNGWVMAASMEEGDVLLRKEIEAQYWRIKNRYAGVECSLDDYGTEDHGREFHEQAIIDTWVLVVHTYPRVPRPSRRSA